MHVLVFADGRSPHTIGWLRGMKSIGLVVSLLSSKTLDDTQHKIVAELLGDQQVHEPRDLWSMARPRIQSLTKKVASHRQPNSAKATRPAGNRPYSPTGPRAIDLLDLAASSRMEKRLQSIVRSSQVDAVHALRVQLEGIVASRALPDSPLAISTWGQDLVSPTSSGGSFEEPTRAAMHRADILFADCERDIQLAPSWGLRAGVKTYRVPGNFGIDVDVLPEKDRSLVAAMGMSNDPVVLYPRGLRSFVNHEGFLEAAVKLVQDGVEANFVGVGLKGVADVPTGLTDRIVLTDHLAHAEMLRLTACAAVLVSPSWSDGMPNSVLEGLAAGGIPVCGELDSLKELEEQGARIEWCDPSDASSIARSIQQALQAYEDVSTREQNKRTVRNYHSTGLARREATTAYQALASLTYA